MMDKPTQDQSRTSRPAGFIVLLTLLLLLSAGDVAWAAPVAQESAVATQRFWPVLLALLTAAFVAERIVEVLWNYLEWFLLSYTSWTPSTLKSPAYMQFKGGTSLLLGAILGVIIANFTSMRIFAVIEAVAPNLVTNVPDAWDVALTGLMIGAVAKPIHDIIGILAQTKNILGYGAIRQREAAGAALAEGVLKLAQSDTESLIDVPGVGPTRLDTPLAGETTDADATDAARAAMESYLALLRDRTAM